jgi:release factor glutamine methyltransferase
VGHRVTTRREGDAPPGETAPTRAGLIAELSAKAGSAREAQWIVEHAEVAAGAAAGGGASAGASGSSAVVVRVADAARALADRRAGGEPLQYVLGRWPFRELELVVDPRVLIPRPETEQLVDVALAELRRIDGRDPAGGLRICIDLGTGSGAIALSLATEAGGTERGGSEDGLEVWATDRSPEALAVACTNLSAVTASKGLRAEVRLRTGRWFEALPARLAGTVDLIVSNPPYVAGDEFDALDATVREWEPPEALVAGSGREGAPGLADVEEIVQFAPSWLKEGGSLVVELAPHQADAAAALARGSGFGDVRIEPDLAGRARFLVARRG